MFKKGFFTVLFLITGFFVYASNDSSDMMTTETINFEHNPEIYTGFNINNTVGAAVPSISVEDKKEQLTLKEKYEKFKLEWSSSSSFVQIGSIILLISGIGSFFLIFVISPILEKRKNK